MSTVDFSVVIGLHSHPGKLCLGLDKVSGILGLTFTQFESVAAFNRSGEPLGFIVFSMQTLPINGIVEPAVLQPTVYVETRFIGLIGIPGAVNASTIAVDRSITAIAGQTRVGTALTVGVARHNPQMQTVDIVAAPLNDISPELHHVTVCLRAQLA